MKRADYLREQASLLRGIAKTFDIRSIRDRILALAEECEQLARLVEKTVTNEEPGARSAPPRARSRSQRRTKAA